MTDHAVLTHAAVARQAPTASDPDFCKKAQFDPTVATPGQVKNASPPLSAQDYISNHIESLHDGIAILLLSRGKEHIALAHRIFMKETNIQRMENHDKYIPISAWGNFCLQPTKAVNELPGYKALRDETYLSKLNRKCSS